MRLIYFSLLLLFGGAVALFVLQNNDPITLHFLSRVSRVRPGCWWGSSICWAW